MKLGQSILTESVQSRLPGRIIGPAPSFNTTIFVKIDDYSRYVHQASRNVAAMRAA